MSKIDKAYRQLASSVLNTALSDKKEAIKKLEINNENENAKKALIDCCSFFKSKWCALLLEFLDIDREKFMEVAHGC